MLDGNNLQMYTFIIHGQSSNLLKLNTDLELIVVEAKLSEAEVRQVRPEYSSACDSMSEYFNTFEH